MVHGNAFSNASVVVDPTKRLSAVQPSCAIGGRPEMHTQQHLCGSAASETVVEGKARCRTVSRPAVKVFDGSYTSKRCVAFRRRQRTMKGSKKVSYRGCSTLEAQLVVKPYSVGCPVKKPGLNKRGLFQQEQERGEITMKGRHRSMGLVAAAMASRERACVGVQWMKFLMQHAVDRDLEKFIQPTRGCALDTAARSYGSHSTGSLQKALSRKREGCNQPTEGMDVRKRHPFDFVWA